MFWDTKHVYTFTFILDVSLAQQMQNKGTEKERRNGEKYCYAFKQIFNIFSSKIPIFFFSSFLF